jgi:Mce-associated membrane protein
VRSPLRRGERVTVEAEVPDALDVDEQGTLDVEDDTDEPRDQRQDDGLDSSSKRQRRNKFLALGLLPAVALVLAVAGGALKWEGGTAAADPSQVAESVRAASDGTIAILSYGPDTVEQDLGAARGRLTGDFLDAYTKLTHDVVIPGAKQKAVTAKATVPSAASVTATGDRAVVIVFVDQTTTIGAGPPSDSASSVRVTLDKRDGRWLISAFDPV